MTLKVISGAQTGADIAGLWAAKHFGIKTSGYAPKGFLTLDGTHPEMMDTFGILQHKCEGYRDRTIDNLKDSGITIVCSEKMSPGTRLTINQCKANKVRYELAVLDPSDMVKSLDDANFIIDEVKKLLERNTMLGYNYFNINIAGNSTKNSIRSFEFTYKFCHRLFTALGYTSSVPVSDWNRYKDTWK